MKQPWYVEKERIRESSMATDINQTNANTIRRRLKSLCSNVKQVAMRMRMRYYTVETAVSGSSSEDYSNDTSQHQRKQKLQFHVSRLPRHVTIRRHKGVSTSTSTHDTSTASSIQMPCHAAQHCIKILLSVLIATAIWRIDLHIQLHCMMIRAGLRPNWA